MTGARMFQDGREVEPDEVDPTRPWFAMSDWLAAGAAKARRQWEPDDWVELGHLEGCNAACWPGDDGGPGAG